MSDAFEAERLARRFYDPAHEGAQVRAVAGVISDSALADLAGAGFRSVVVLIDDHLAHDAAALAVTLLGPLPLPVVVARQLPSYVGALDVVLAVASHGESPDLERGLALAAGRGSVTVLAGPPEGPVPEDAPEDTARIPVLPGVTTRSPARVAAAVLAVVQSLSRTPDAIAGHLRTVADAIDHELEALSPERDPLVNPARTLLEGVQGRRVVHTGATPAGAAVARIAATLWTEEGLTSASLSDASALRPEQEPDLFHDPYLDPEPAMLPLVLVLWDADPRAAAQGSRVLPQSGDLDAAAEAATSDTWSRSLGLVARAWVSAMFA